VIDDGPWIVGDDQVQALRINESHGITLDVGVGVHAALEPNRIALHIPADCRIIIPEVVVVEVRLLVEMFAALLGNLSRTANVLTVLLTYNGNVNSRASHSRDVAKKISSYSTSKQVPMKLLKSGVSKSTIASALPPMSRADNHKSLLVLESVPDVAPI
jgi:hypothetical protein